MSDKTATEFIPTADRFDYIDEPRIVYHKLTNDGEMKMVNRESGDDSIIDHKFICDQCGCSKPFESDMKRHLEHCESER